MWVGGWEGGGGVAWVGGWVDVGVHVCLRHVCDCMYMHVCVSKLLGVTVLTRCVCGRCWVCVCVCKVLGVCVCVRELLGVTVLRKPNVSVSIQTCIRAYTCIRM